jgi:dTDP-4-amino-4,6-dideoxygalactose transaminase
MADVARQYHRTASRTDSVLMRVLDGGRYILGPEVSEFEDEMAAYIGCENAVGVASGTDALLLILKAMGIGPGDEVVTTAFTFFATAEVIALTGAVPVFADIDPLTFNLDPERAAERITPATKAVIVVHLYGQPADMDAFTDLSASGGVPLIEDCAQAAGASYRERKVGTFGAASAFSFFPTKNLGCCGDGGMVCTGDTELAAEVRMLANHGQGEQYLHEAIGMNSRLDEVQAAILRIRLEHLDEWNAERARIAARYDEAFGEAAPQVAEGVNHVYHQYTLRPADRDALSERLAEDDIASRVYYPVPMHLQPCFKDLGYSPGDLPNTEAASREVLSLPIFPSMSDEEIGRVCAAGTRKP